MEQKNGNGSAPSPDIADLRGKRLVLSSEPAEGARLSESLIKYLCGMGTIKARHLHREHFEFKQTWVFFLDCNHKPVIRGSDAAIWNRIGLVPFDVVIPDHEIDRDLPEKLRQELPGILAWMVRGCLEWQRTGLNPPDRVTSATSEYRSEMDIIGRFIEERCVVGDFASGRANSLYKSYAEWCQESGETSTSVMTFGCRLTERGFSKGHDRQGVRYEGIGLRNDK
jgi:putative DNA primase/helicase